MEDKRERESESERERERQRERQRKFKLGGEKSSCFGGRTAALTMTTTTIK